MNWSILMNWWTGLCFWHTVKSYSDSLLTPHSHQQGSWGTPTAIMVKQAERPYSCRTHCSARTGDRGMSTGTLTHNSLPEDKNTTDVRIYANTCIPTHDSCPGPRRICRSLKNPPQPRKKSAHVSGNKTKCSALIKEQWKHTQRNINQTVIAKSS